MKAMLSPWLDWLDSQYESMLSNTITLAEINSGSLNVKGVNQVRETLEKLFAPLQGETKVIAVEPYKRLNAEGDIETFPLGDALTIRKRPTAPLQIFLCGHLDTVFAIDHPFQTIRWLDDETLNGPGVTDLKGGLMVMLKALQAFERSPWAEKIGWQILFNPDEEIGSPGSAPLIAEMAKQVDLGLIYEPAFPDGNLAGERKGSGNFSVSVHGRAAHAGREHHLGRNAIRAMCDFVSSLDDLNGQRTGVTINPGTIHGGSSVNAVPDSCVSHFNVRTRLVSDEKWFKGQLQALVDLINQRDGIHLQIYGGFGRQPKALTQQNIKLLQITQQCGESLGMELDYIPTGGCCDGNNLAAVGVPNIDTLGVVGGKIHSSDEFLKVRSLTERAKLSALILMTLANSDTDWLKQRYNTCANAKETL